jgi:cellulose synthase/poly-beta-1,6-N-acetylglucosamine synthase-like glycosyltransferase
VSKINFIPLAVASASFAAVATIYGWYVILVLRNRKINDYLELVTRATSAKPNPEDLPNVTIIMPACNEENSIPMKFSNFAEMKYPIEKIEVLVLDDCSTDRTCEIADGFLKRLGFRGEVLRNAYRMGPNASYNVGVPRAKGSLILRTDADVLIEPDALTRAVQIMARIENVGGITGTMDTVKERATSATGLEENYRGLFDQMSTAESALYSTFSGGGGFALLRKSSFSPIPIDRGSTDANISLSIIRKGLKYVYVPCVFSCETITHRLGEQIRQKVRRASRLLQSTLLNKDILFKKEYKEFGTVIFPLRFAMLLLCPPLVLLGLLSVLVFFSSFSIAIAVFSAFGFCVFLYVGAKVKIKLVSSVASFLFHQFYLLLGLVFLERNKSIWKSVERANS